MKTLIPLLLMAFGFLSLAAIPPSEIEAGSKLLGANLVDEVTFQEGSPLLSRDAKDDLQNFVKTAEQRGPISEIRVAVWSDNEEPSDTKANKKDVQLAADRGNEVIRFIRQDLQHPNVTSYNMSERPNPLQKIFRETKDSEYIFTRAQKSKAIIMIYYH